MRTASVVVFTQAEMFVLAGAAMAAVPASSKATSAPGRVSDDIETSRERSENAG